MADDVRVTNFPSTDGKERVAYDLANRIAQGEQNTRDRAYWLKLYAECLRIVNGGVFKQD